LEISLRTAFPFDPQKEEPSKIMVEVCHNQSQSRPCLFVIVAGPLRFFCRMSSVAP